MIKRSKNQPHNKFDTGGRKKITAHKRALRLPDSHLREPIKYGFFNADDSLSPQPSALFKSKTRGAALDCGELAVLLRANTTRTPTRASPLIKCPKPNHSRPPSPSRTQAPPPPPHRTTMVAISELG
jgi:hypothetical protein